MKGWLKASILLPNECVSIKYLSTLAIWSLLKTSFTLAIWTINFLEVSFLLKIWLKFILLSFEIDMLLPLMYSKGGFSITSKTRLRL